MIPVVGVTVHNFLLWLGSFIGFALLVASFVLIKVGGSSVAARFGKALDARAARIEAQLRLADENQAAARRAHEEAQAVIAQAHTEAAEIVARAEGLKGSLRHELAAAAEEDKNRIVGQAREEIEAERNRAILELRARASDVAVDAAREVLRQTVDAKTDQALIRRALSEDNGNGRSGG